MTRDEAEQQYRETCDRMGTDADPGGVLAGGPMAESKADELRRLAQAVVDAAMAPYRMSLGFAPLDDASHALGNIIGVRKMHSDQAEYAAHAILAALDDATEQGRAAGDAAGYARAMREVAEYGESDPCPICQTAEWARTRAEVPRG